MDIINQLINLKKETQDNNLPIREIIDELVMYEKLSKSNKFKHITENQILQKKLPYCWKAFNNDAEAYWILNETATIMQHLKDEPLQIFQDLNATYTERKRTQMEILGNVLKHNIRYHDKRSLIYLQSRENIITITEQINDVTRFVIIHFKDKQNTNIYSGEINEKEMNNTVVKKSTATSIKPYIYSKDNDYVKIKSYSLLGNNDYTIAETKHYNISLKDNNHIVYISKTNRLDTKIVEMEPKDVNMLNTYMSNIELLAKTLFKYKPKTGEAES